MALQQTNPRPGGPGRFNEFGRRVDQPVENPQPDQQPTNPADGFTPTRERLDLEPTRFSSPGRARATTRTVGADELASTQLDRLLAEDSPLRRRAMQEGIDYAASRGLLNSSIAGGNAVGAFIDRAVPIATFDASQYGTAARDNQSANNQISLFNASEQGQNSRFNASAENSLRDLIATGKINTLARLGTEDFKNLFQQDQNEFAASMRSMDRDLQREGYDSRERQSILSAISQSRNNQARIQADAAINIYNNPDLTAGEQNLAVENFRNSIVNPGFNDLVSQFPNLPNLFPDLFTGG